MIHDANLFDCWKHFNPVPESGHYDVEKNNFTWRGSDSGKFKNTAMRLDHAFMSRSLESKLIESTILGTGYSRIGFLGSDHAPLKIVLTKN